MLSVPDISQYTVLLFQEKQTSVLLLIFSGNVLLLGETRLTVDGRDRGGKQRLNKLSDGTWHRIDIFQHRKVSHFV